MQILTYPSWIGPLVVGIVNDATGDIRWGVLAIIPYLAVGFVTMMLAVNETQGVKDVRAVEKLEAQKKAIKKA